jgi:hypothetical protein
LNFLKKFSKDIPVSNFMKILPVRDELFHADRERGGQGERRTGREADRETGGQGERRTGRQADKGDRRTGKEADRETGGQGERQTGRQAEKLAGVMKLRLIFHNFAILRTRLKRKLITRTHIQTERSNG